MGTVDRERDIRSAAARALVSAQWKHILAALFGGVLDLPAIGDRESAFASAMLVMMTAVSQHPEWAQAWQAAILAEMPEGLADTVRRQADMLPQMLLIEARDG